MLDRLETRYFKGRFVFDEISHFPLPPIAPDGFRRSSVPLPDEPSAVVRILAVAACYVLEEVHNCVGMCDNDRIESPPRTLRQDVVESLVEAYESFAPILRKLRVFAVASEPGQFGIVPDCFDLGDL